MMAVTLDNFCSYIFPPLLLLGLWCLFEGGSNVCLNMLLLVMSTVFKTKMQWSVFYHFFFRNYNSRWEMQELVPSLQADRGALEHG